MKGWILALLAGVSWGSGLVFAFYPYLLIEGGGIGIFAGATVASSLVYLLGNLDSSKWCPKALSRRRTVVSVLLLSLFFLMAVCVPWRSSLLGMLDILKVPLTLAEGIHWFLLSFSLVALFRFLSFFFRWFQVLELGVLVLLIASPVYGPMHHGSGKPHWLFDHLIEAEGQSSKLPFWVISAFASLPILCFFLSFDGRGKPADEKSKRGLPVLSGMVFVLGFCLAVAASFQARSLIEEDNRPEPPIPPPNPFEPPPPPQPPPLALIDLPDSKITEPEGYYFRVGILEESNQSVASLKFKPLGLEREENGSWELNSSSHEQLLLTKVYPYDKEVPQLFLKDARRMRDIRPIPKGGFSDAYMVDSTKNDFSFRQAYGKYLGKTGRVFETEKDKLVSSLRKAGYYNAVIIGRDQNPSRSSRGNRNAITFFREFSENKSLQKIKEFAAEKLRLRLSPAVEFYFVINSLENTFALSDEQGKEHLDSPIQAFMKGDYNGSSSHFALAAYYWLQARNIPCRLVTGYFLPKKGDKVEDAAYVLPTHQRIWLEGFMGKKGMFQSDPRWTPIFISPKVIIDQNQPEEPDDPPEPPDEEEEDQEQESTSPQNSPLFPDEQNRLSFFLSLGAVLVAIMLLLLVVRSFFRFNLFFRHKNYRATAMIIALRWLDLYDRRREYGESVLEFAVRLEEELDLKCFRAMAETHRREFTCPNNSREERSYWKKKLKELRNALGNHKNLRSPKKFCRDVLWKVFGFPDYPPNVQNTHKARGANQ